MVYRRSQTERKKQKKETRQKSQKEPKMTQNDLREYFHSLLYTLAVGGLLICAGQMMSANFTDNGLALFTI